MPLSFLPACRPLLLGSLPYRSVSQAISTTRRYAADIMVWPHLPQRSFRETGVVQSAAGFPGLVVDAMHRRVYVDRADAEEGLAQLGLAYLKHDISFGALPDEDASGLVELHRQRESLRSVRAVKSQLMGPISLAAHLTDEDERPLMYDDTLFEALTHHLYLRAAWQSSQLAELNSNTIICLDEPFLDTAALPFLPFDWERVHEALNEVFRAVDGCRAIYVGSAAHLRTIVETCADLVISDALAPASVLWSDPPALTALLEREGMLGLGVVPTSAEELEQRSAEHLVDAIEHVVSQLGPHGIDLVTLLNHSFLTPQSTLGQVAPEVADQVLEKLDQVSQQCRQRYGLE